MAKLSMYPKWKLLKLDEFAGSLGQVFAFLDNVSDSPRDVFKELGYDKDSKQLEHNPSKQIARDCNAHIQKMLMFCGEGKMNDEELENKRRVEKVGLEELSRKYPHSGFNKVLSEKRFN